MCVIIYEGLLSLLDGKPRLGMMGIQGVTGLLQNEIRVATIGGDVHHMKRARVSETRCSIHLLHREVMILMVRILLHIC